MAEYSVIYWQDIPSLVEARDETETVKVPLTQRFQELIDAVAMREGLAGTDEYLDHWRQENPQPREGSAQAVAEAVATELEGQFADLRARKLRAVGEGG